MRLIIMALLAYAIGLTAGLGMSVAHYGDLIIMRNAAGCVAFDPDRGQNSGSWAIGDDGRCHLRDFYFTHPWKLIFA